MLHMAQQCPTSLTHKAKVIVVNKVRTQQIIPVPPVQKTGVLTTHARDLWKHQQNQHLPTHPQSDYPSQHASDLQAESTSLIAIQSPPDVDTYTAVRSQWHHTPVDLGT